MKKENSLSEEGGYNLPRTNESLLKQKNRFFFKLILRSSIFLLLLIWCLGIIFEIIIPNSAFAVLSHPILKKIYGTVCHQLDEKTFSIEGNKFFVCARCTGIYLGAFIISFSSLFSFKKITGGLKPLYFSMIPLLLDVTFTSLGIYPYNKYLAFATGIFFGSVVFVYILAAIENNF